MRDIRPTAFFKSVPDFAIPNQTIALTGGIATQRTQPSTTTELPQKPCCCCCCCPKDQSGGGAGAPTRKVGEPKVIGKIPPPIPAIGDEPYPKAESLVSSGGGGSRGPRSTPTRAAAPGSVQQQTATTATQPSKGMTRDSQSFAPATQPIARALQSTRQPTMPVQSLSTTALPAYLFSPLGVHQPFQFTEPGVTTAADDPCPPELRKKIEVGIFFEGFNPPPPPAHRVMLTCFAAIAAPLLLRGRPRPSAL